jgi:hypothetical protein
MILFLQGAITICFLVAGAFFLRFWKQTHDRLFLLFALSFWIQACTRIALTVVSESDGRVYFYLLRLLAFGLILAAIAMKNIGGSRMKKVAGVGTPLKE